MTGFQQPEGFNKPQLAGQRGQSRLVVAQQAGSGRPAQFIESVRPWPDLPRSTKGIKTVKEMWVHLALQHIEFCSTDICDNNSFSRQAFLLLVHDIERPKASETRLRAKPANKPARDHWSRVGSRGCASDRRVE